MKSNSIDGVAEQSNESRQSLVLYDSTSDIISNLPKDVINDIMIRLPISDAARTSVLSKEWKQRWLYTPQLEFDFDYHRRLLSKNQDQAWFQICRILSLHRGPLRKFYLLVKMLGEYGRRFVDQIMIFLSGKDIQNVTLLIREERASETPYKLPSYFFQCTQLTDLYLSHCEFRFPSGFIGFSKLTVLQLHNFGISADDLKSLISKSTLLQELQLEEIDYNGRALEIDAPNLKLLFFVNVSCSVIFKNVPVLPTFRIAEYKGFLGDVPDIVKVFDCLPSIEYLDVDAAFLADSSRGLIPERLPSMLNHLKSIELDEMNFNSFKEVQCALLLIRSSPKLQTLLIDLTYCVDADDAVEQLFKSPSLVEDSFYQLQEVTLQQFNGIFPELELVKFLLAKSLTLKKIVIQPYIGISCEEVVEILRVVTQFQRVSPKAEILFFDIGMFCAHSVI